MNVARLLLWLPWFIIGTVVPVGAWVMLEPSPIDIQYVHPKFVAHQVYSREEAEQAEITAARGGATVYRYLEYRVHRPFTATVLRSWTNNAMVWHAPTTSTGLTRTEGLHRATIAIETPTSAPSRNMQFVQHLHIPVNWARVVEYEYRPIPLRLLSPQDADALGCATTCRQ
jgi:hypothetical protein